MAKKGFNFNDLSGAPMTQASTDAMAEVAASSNVDVNPNPNVDTTNGNAETRKEEQDVHSSMPIATSTNPVPDVVNLPAEQGGAQLPAEATVMSCVEHIAARRMQVLSEYNGARTQAINLKTFPASADWELKEIIEKFKDNCTPGTPKLTKGALAEMLLIDAVHDMYLKVCKH